MEIQSGNLRLYVVITYFHFSEKTELHVERLESAVRGLENADWIVSGDMIVRSTLWDDKHTDRKWEVIEDILMSGEMICCNTGSVLTFLTNMGFIWRSRQWELPLTSENRMRTRMRFQVITDFSHSLRGGLGGSRKGREE